MGCFRVGWVLPVWLGLSVAGCVEPPGATRIVGPDGSSMLHLHCVDDQAACFLIAGEQCPRGYDLSPVFDPRDGNFLVRCRVAEPAQPPLEEVTRARERPARTPDSSAGAGSQWPPTEVAKPSEPWPTEAPDRSQRAPARASTVVDPGF